MPISSGYCLGSCNWLLETEFSKVCIIHTFRERQAYTQTTRERGERGRKRERVREKERARERGREGGRERERERETIFTFP